MNVGHAGAPGSTTQPLSCPDHIHVVGARRVLLTATIWSCTCSVADGTRSVQRYRGGVGAVSGAVSGRCRAECQLTLVSECRGTGVSGWCPDLVSKCRARA